MAQLPAEGEAALTGIGANHKLMRGVRVTFFVDPKAFIDRQCSTRCGKSPIAAIRHTQQGCLFILGRHDLNVGTKVETNMHRRALLGSALWQQRIFPAQFQTVGAQDQEP